MNGLGSVLVVDDDPDVREMVAEYLRDEGYKVTTAEDAAALHATLDVNATDLVFLDLRLPDGDGLEIARGLRQSTDIGIIILTGKDDVLDRVAGLEIGADDYIAKPFHLRELLARLKAVLRRRSTAEQNHFQAVDPQPAVDPLAPLSSTPASSSRPTSPSRQPAGPVMRFAGWKLDLGSRSLWSPDGETVDLTGGTFDLLVVFAENPGRVLSRAALLDLVRHDEEVFDRAIDMRVRRLRTRIETDPRRPALIKTVRGVGYMFTAQVESD